MNNYKKALFGFITLLIFYGIIELAAFTAYFFAEGRPFSFSSMRTKLTDAIGTAGGNDPDNMNMPSDIVAQPYWGYVAEWAYLTPEQLGAPSSERLTHREGMDRGDDQSIILNGPDYAIPTRTAESVNVVILGGSVAIQIARKGSRQLVAELQRFDEYRGRKIILYNAAQSALKQPQQITKLSYLLALGSEFDVIINIDGLNEVYQSMKNSELGVFPFFPAFWHRLVEKTGSSAAIQLVAETTFLSERRSSLAQLVASQPCRYSITCNTVWFLLDRWLLSQITQRRILLNDLSASNTYVTSGPRFPLMGQDSLPQEIADTWMRSSLGLKALANEFGAEYFHFLQPNQYLPNSKPMDPAERKKAFLEDSELNTLVPEIYPLLVNNGKQLQSAGVNFYDLTMIFRNQREARYKDTCCHVNKTGARELAQQIGRSVVQQLEAQKNRHNDS